MPESSSGLIVSNSEALAAVRHSHIVNLWRVRTYTWNELLPAAHHSRERLLSLFLTVKRVLRRGELVDVRAWFDFIYSLAHFIRCAVWLLYLDGFPRRLAP